MYVKFLDGQGKSSYQRYKWPRPRGKRPGKWVYATGQLVLCLNGIHAARAEDALDCVDEQCFEIELGGEILAAEHKVCGRRGRLIRKLHWNTQTQRLFACECAEHVVHFADDARCNETIRVARRFAFKMASMDELNAARTAAGVAATGATRNVVLAAAWSAATNAVWAATETASWAVSGAAAWAAAGIASRNDTLAAVRAHERAWQSALLERVLMNDGTWLEEQRAKAVESK